MKKKPEESSLKTRPKNTRPTKKYFKNSISYTSWLISPAAIMNCPNHLTTNFYAIDVFAKKIMIINAVTSIFGLIFLPWYGRVFMSLRICISLISLWPALLLPTPAVPSGYLASWSGWCVCVRVCVCVCVYVGLTGCQLLVWSSPCLLE